MNPKPGCMCPACVTWRKVMQTALPQSAITLSAVTVTRIGGMAQIKARTASGVLIESVGPSLTECFLDIIEKAK